MYIILVYLKGSGGGGEYGLRERDMPSSSYNLRGGDDRFYGDRENRPRERYDGGGYGAARAVERRTSGGLGGASSRRKSLSDVENPRPTPRDTNDEDMQLQIALQISREEAEKVRLHLRFSLLVLLISSSSARCIIQELSLFGSSRRSLCTAEYSICTVQYNQDF